MDVYIMNRRPVSALTRHDAANRSHLTLVRDEPLPVAVANAAQIDPTLLEPVPPRHVDTRSTRTAATFADCEPHEVTLVPGRLDWFPYMDGTDRGRFRVVSEVTGDFIASNVPIYANTPEVNRAFWAFVEAVERAHPSRR